MREYFKAIDWTVGIFNVIVGLLCLSSAASNILIYGISIRVIALAVFFAFSGFLFIILELVQDAAAWFVQNQISHLNSYHGRALHYLLLASLSCDSYNDKGHPLAYLIWLWSITLALASFAIAFGFMACLSSFSSWLPLPKSMDFKRAQEKSELGPDGKIRRNDGVFEYESALPIRQKGSTPSSSSWRNGMVMENDMDRSRFNGRPLSLGSRLGGGDHILFEPISLNNEKEDGFSSKHSSPLQNFRSNNSIEDFHHHHHHRHRRPSSIGHHTLVDMQEYHQNPNNAKRVSIMGQMSNSSSSQSFNTPSTPSLGTSPKSSANSPPVARVDTLLRFSNVPQGEAVEQLNSARTSMVHSSNDSTPKIGGIQKLFGVGGPRRSSNTPSVASLRYETVNDRKAIAEGKVEMNKKIRSNEQISPFHHQISYDNQNSFDSYVISSSSSTPPRLTLPLSITSKKEVSKRIGKRVYVPSIGAAVDLSSGSESEESGDENIQDDDADRNSVYSLPSGISPAEDLKQQFLSHSHEQSGDQSLDEQFGRRLTRKETRSVRKKLDRGIQRALSQRREE